MKRSMEDMYAEFLEWTNQVGYTFPTTRENLASRIYCWFAYLGEPAKHAEELVTWAMEHKT